MRLLIKLVHRDVKAARQALLAELERLDRLELDPRSVPGSLLIAFYGQEGPSSPWGSDEGWVEEDPSWTTDPAEAKEYDMALYSPTGRYNIEGVCLVSEEGNERPLESFLREFMESQK